MKESIYIKNKKGEGGEKQGEKRRERTRQGVEGETEGKKKKDEKEKGSRGRARMQEEKRRMRGDKKRDSV